MEEVSMKTKWIVLTTLFLATHTWAGAVPSQITYQGTLKQSGGAANGNFNMTFRLTDSGGLTQYWTSGVMTVSVSQGLFSAVLSPSGVDWQNVLPYVEVNVNGQVLLPRVPVTSNAYALMSGSVVDGAITTPKVADGAITQAKLDPGVQGLQIPAGMIAMFSGSCPAGWARFSVLDNRFPMGGAVYGSTGGSATHTHTTPDHQHTLAVSQTNINAGCFAGPVGVGAGGGSGLVTMPSGANCLYNQLANYTTVGA